MSLSVTDDWESGKIYRTDSGDMVRSKQERFIANILTQEGISFEYERELLSLDGFSCRYPDFTLFINGKQYYWEHWGMLDDYSYRQYIAKKIRWYSENGYSDDLIQTWGGGDRDLKGQVLVNLYKLRLHGRRKREYDPVPTSHPEEDKKIQNISILIIIVIILTFSVLFSSKDVPTSVAMSETPPRAPKTISGKKEPEKELLREAKGADLSAEEIQTEETTIEKRGETEIFWMGIKIFQ